MDHFISGFHLGTAISALIFGACIFFTRKGSRLHKQAGYAYFFNMLGLNISACLFIDGPVISDRFMVRL